MLLKATLFINSLYHKMCDYSVSSHQVPAARSRSTFSLYVTAARPPTSKPLFLTGRSLEMAVFACRNRRRCVRPAQQWDVRSYAWRCLNGVTHTYLFRCSYPCVRRRHARSRMCVRSSLPTHTSVDRAVCVWTGEAPTSAVSQFLINKRLQV